MVIIENYPLAVIFCVMAMICWGSWQNTRNLIGSDWRFELYYWDFTTGILIFSIIGAFTIGSLGNGGRSFMNDLGQAETINLLSAFLGGVIWNLGTLLLVAGISIAGMSVAFPIGGGIGWVCGIIINYIGAPTGNPFLLFTGCIMIVIAIMISMKSFQKLSSSTEKPAFKGIILSLLAGTAIAFFYRFVAYSIISDYVNPEIGKITPYTAVFMMSLGAFISTFFFNSFLMKKPVAGSPLTFSDYFKGGQKTHLLGIIGGCIWCLGTLFSFMASGQAGFAISYGLSNSAPVIAALWGIFVWKEFKNAPEGTNKLLAFMFVFYLLGLALIMSARFS